MSSSNNTSKGDTKTRADDDKPPPDTDEGFSEYMTPNKDESSGEIKQCKECHCWTDDREHKCEPEHKDKYAKGG